MLAWPPGRQARVRAPVLQLLHQRRGLPVHRGRGPPARRPRMEAAARCTDSIRRAGLWRHRAWAPERGDEPSRVAPRAACDPFLLRPTECWRVSSTLPGRSSGPWRRIRRRVLSTIPWSATSSSGSAGSRCPVRPSRGCDATAIFVIAARGGDHRHPPTLTLGVLMSTVAGNRAETIRRGRRRERGPCCGRRDDGDRCGGVQLRLLREAVRAASGRLEPLLRRVPDPGDDRAALQPDRGDRERDDVGPAAGVGFRPAQAVRMDARPGDGVRDDRHHEQRHPRLPAPDDVPDLSDADVDGVGARPVPGLQDPRPACGTRLDWPDMPGSRCAPTAPATRRRVHPRRAPRSSPATTVSRHEPREAHHCRARRRRRGAACACGSAAAAPSGESRAVLVCEQGRAGRGRGGGGAAARRWAARCSRVVDLGHVAFNFLGTSPVLRPRQGGRDLFSSADGEHYDVGSQAPAANPFAATSAKGA